MIPLWLLVIGPLTVAAFGYFLPRRHLRIVAVLSQLVQIVLSGALLLAVRESGVQTEILGGWPVGTGIRLEADSVAAAMVAVSAWFYLLVLLFNQHKQYMDSLFQFLFLTLQSILVGLFLSGDLFNVYVLLELSTLIVSILIMYKRNKQALYNGMVYMTLNLASMSFMLLGVGFTYRVFGTLDLRMMAEIAATTGNARDLILPYAFVMTAVGMKSALFMLFAWLPPAHGSPSAPSIVSAVLSGLQVKAGVFLFMRLQSIYAPVLPVESLMLVVGVLTAISGFMLAITQADLKLILAYHTISQVGLIITGLSVGTPEAWWGATYHMVNHALFKGLLFLVAGTVIRAYGTRSVYEIRGVMRDMPLVAIAGLAGVLGITGAPYFNGSVSKYLIQSGWDAPIGEMLILIINGGTAISFVKFSTIFFGAAPNAAHTAADTAHDEADTSHTDADSASAAKTVVKRPVPFTTPVSLAMGVLVLAGGIGASYAMEMLYGVSLSIAGAFQAAKFLTFGVTVAAAFLIYHFGIKRMVFLARVRNFTFSFPDLATGIVLFFASTVGYLLLAI